MARKLKGQRIAILVENGFEQVEMTEPRKALEEAGARADLISPAGDEVRGWNFTDWGDRFKVDVPLNSARPEDYDALLLPGGVMSPDKLRMNPDALRFVRAQREISQTAYRGLLAPADVSALSGAML